MALTEEERDEKLRQLADNTKARIQEQTELENREASLFGLAVHKLDEDGIERAASPWLGPAQLGGLVEQYLAGRSYERAVGLFSRPVAVLRPDKAVRAALLQDTKALGTSGAVVVRWTQWLDGGDQARRMTFDPELADADDVELLSPSHPLVRAAARFIGEPRGTASVSLRAVSVELPPGRYPFNVYAWTTLGIRDEFELRVLTPEPALDDAVARALLTADTGAVVAVEEDAPTLETAHYDAWVSDRAEHLEQTRVYVAAQLASLELSHRARVAQLEDQIATATHPNIARMHEGTLRSAVDDYSNRTKELELAVNRCDVTTALLCSGVLEVQ